MGSAHTVARMRRHAISQVIIYKIMDLAIEDATPLFDIANVVIAARADLTENSARQLAKRYVRALVHDQYLDVLRDCLELSSESHRHLVTLNHADAMREIEDDANWSYHPRRGATAVWITVGATEKGERSHRAGHIALDL
jgi:hypothetical protein